MKLTGIVRDDVFLRHDMGRYHPENPRRLEVIYSVVDRLRDDLNLVEIPVRSAEIAEIARNHSPEYVEKIAATAGKRSTYLDPDTSTSADSWDAASKAVGGLLNLVDAVVRGEVRNGFGLVRPPGHHAEWDRAMGFCLFNNIALAARHALAEHGMERIAIVDWDLHHGNGTQHSFYDDPRVLFISTHQYPHYPGTGSIEETGKGKGEGFTVNVPLGPGAGDEEFVAIVQSVVVPVLRSYKPEFVLLSAGFDAHARDPLGALGITEQGYGDMLKLLMDAAGEVCSERLILTLEGGYDLDALASSVGVVLSTLARYNGDEAARVPIPDEENLHPRARRILAEVRSSVANHWPDIE
jgi:acetoin utilization deacetylase AcuC-like enzyme